MTHLDQKYAQFVLYPAMQEARSPAFMTLKHWGQVKMAAISETTLSCPFRN